MGNARTAPTPTTVVNNQEIMMKTVKIELKWQWKLEGAWGVTVLMVALPHLTSLPSWLGLA
mgnify:CR=1 FL=1